jgi:ribosomal protein S18 acetylase RimI-like enzyme
VSAIIRRARADDFDAWYDLRVDVAAEGVWIGAEPPVVRDEEAFVGRLSRDDAASFVADDDGSIVGAIGVDDYGGVASFGMWVASSHRGRGVGRALLDAAVTWAAGAGAHKVTLEVWPHNGPAIALYRSAGFVVEGRKVRHYRRRNGELWDSLMMAKALDAESPGSPHADA